MNIYNQTLKYIIYQATNKVNNKSYNGFTQDFKQRKRSHKSESLKGSNFAFHCAIRKYGWENFEWKIIYQSNDKDFILNIMESYLIKYYDTLCPNGYNMSFGGELPPSRKGSKLSKEHKGAFVNSRGPISEEGRLKLSEYRLNNPMSKEVITKSNNTKKKNPKFHRVIVFPDGKEIFVDSITEFCKKYNLDRNSIYNLYSGRILYYKGFKIYQSLNPHS